MSEEKRALTHCWEDGPETEDGCSTTCMLLDGHDGPHKWTSDDEIGISFAKDTEAERTLFENLEKIVPLRSRFSK